MIVKFRFRRDTAANWTAVNPILDLGEPGLETDTRRVKYGDGVTPWNTLAYSAGTVFKTVGGVSLLGTGDIGTIGVPYGGTGAVTHTSGALIKGNGTSALSASIIKDNGVEVGVGANPIGDFRLFVQGVDNSGSKWAGVFRNDAGTNLFVVSNSGAFSTGAAAASPYNDTTTDPPNLVVSSTGYLRRSTSLSSGGSVTSVGLSGGTTGLSATGGPITTSGTFVLGGTLNPANGGTGAVTLTGYIKGNGTSPFTASSTIPGTDITGNISGSAAKITTSRTIAMSGDIVWSTNFDGSVNVTAAATLATVNGTVGSFGGALAVPIVTVNGKGLVTNVATAALGTASALASDADTTLAANSDTRVPTQKAVKAYIDASVAGLLDFKGNLNCAANPNYPVALKGDAYYVSAAGKIGGASGKSVDIGDVIVASVDNAGGTEASVGTSWFVLEHNLTGALASANNLSDLASAATARTNLGATTVGGNVFTLTNPSGITYLRFNADNTVTAITGTQLTASLDDATTLLPGRMTAASLTKLNGIAANATANATDGQLRDRTTHTGTQPIASVAASAGARLYGRYTASAGAGQEITIGANLTLDSATGVLSASGGGGGGISDGDKGDITVSASGATWTIDPKAVDLSKMDDMASGSFIARNAGGVGPPQVVSAATALSMMGATTVGTNLLTLTNPSATTYLRLNADNTVSTLNAATFLAAIGAQAALVSGTNLKTIGGATLLGSGDLGTIGVPYGGTGATTHTSGSLIKGNGTSALSASIIRDNGTETAIGTTPNATFRLTIKGTGTGSGTYPLVVRNSADTNLLFMQDDGALYTGSAAFSPYNNTTASAANVFISNSAGQLLRSTSSRRYKRDIENIDAELADKVTALRPVWYRSTASADNPAWGYWGFIAEEVAEIDPRLVHWGYAPEDYVEVVVQRARPPKIDRRGKVEPGCDAISERRLRKGAQQRPDGVQYERIAVLLQDVVRRDRLRLDAIEKYISDDIKARMG